MDRLRLFAVLGLFLSGLAVAGFSRDFPRSDQLLERHFSRDWSRVEESPVSEPRSAQGTPIEPAEKPVEDLHNPVAHMHMTRMAYLLYAAHYDGSELERYIGDLNGSKPATDDDDRVVEGAYDEDKPFKNPWGQAASILRHFWDCRKGPGAGLAGHDSGVNRAQKYFTGGTGLDGKYDGVWSGEGGKGRGTPGEGVISLYQSGRKGKAYWYLGHAAHLLEDLTVPAHALLYPHPLHLDDYEVYTRQRYQDWNRIPPGRVESFDSLYDLFYQTADAANDYDAGNGPGPWGGRDGENDFGTRRMSGFDEDELKEVADVLMPLAHRRVAALFLYFYKQVDKAPPLVALSAAEGPDDSGLTLNAKAQDEASGVDREGYRFEYSVWTAGGWSSWREASSGSSQALFAASARDRYAFRASAVDAVGNRGFSEVLYLPAEPAPAASAR